MRQKKQRSIGQTLWESKTKAAIERQIAEIGWGILMGLKENWLTIEQAERDLFNLDTYEAALRQRLNPHLIKFLAWGMELEDVVEIVPEALEESYRGMERELKRLTFAKPRRSARTSGTKN